jgi:hypothetical protein
MRETHGVGGALVGAILAAAQINFFTGLPLYLLIARASAQMDILPDTSRELLVLSACLAPVFLFLLWSSFRTPPGDEALRSRGALAWSPSSGDGHGIERRLGAGEFDDALRSLAEAVGTPPGQLHRLDEGQRRIREALDENKRASGEAADGIVGQVRDRSPADAYLFAREHTGSDAAAAQVRFRVWQAQTRELDHEEFNSVAAAVEADEVLHVDYTNKMIVIDEERERRGLPQTELQPSDESSLVFWQLNSVVASGRADEGTRRAAALAEAATEVAAARERRADGDPSDLT